MRRFVKETMIIGLAIVALVYLMMPSLLPDFIPGIGWLDEGFATLVLANTLRYYNLDLTSLYKKDEPKVKYVPQQVAYTQQPQASQSIVSQPEYEIHEETGMAGEIQYVTRQKPHSG